jgi:hypothetical protein
MKHDSGNEPVIQTPPRLPRISVLDGFRHCMHDLGIDPVAHLQEVLRLSRLPGRVSVRDYFYYRLYDPTLSDADRRRFVGSRLERKLHRFTFDREHYRLATDKCLFESTLRAAGFPTPETLCLYQNKADEDSAVFHKASTSADLEAWLQDASVYPVFGKPRTGIRSGGVLALESCDSATGELVVGNGRRVAVSSLIEAIKSYRRKGYLFQRQLRPHAEVAEISADAIATVRLVLLVKSTGPSVYHAAWKLPANRNIADNFWRGNVLAGLNPETGEVVRAISGIGSDMSDISHHPDSGRPLLGLRVPGWKELRTLCLDASRHITGIDMQAWDIAVTDAGPVLMEVNIGGDYCLPQLGLNKGMLEEEFVRFLADCAERRNLVRKYNRLGLQKSCQPQDEMAHGQS